MTRIPALTLWRPWPALIYRAGKRHENRGWSTTYRGPMYIHSGKRWDADALDFAAAIPTGNGRHAIDWISRNPDDHPQGITGVAHLVDCRQGEVDSWAAPGQFNWRLDRPKEFPEPVPCRGAQGLWWPHTDLYEALHHALRVVGLVAP